MATRTRQPTIPLTEIEHAAFCKTEDELPSKSLAEEQAVNVRWQKLPTEYLHYTAEELDQRIHRAKEKLGSSVTILGHCPIWSGRGTPSPGGRAFRGYFLPFTI